MSFLKRLFGNSKTQAPTVRKEPVFNIPEGKEEDFFGKGRLLLDMKERKLDGILVKGFFSPEELEQILERMPSVGPVTNVIPGLATYPMAFAQAGQMLEKGQNDLEEYFQLCSEVQKKLADDLGIDILGRVKSLLGTIAEGLEQKAARMKGFGGQLTEISVRFIDKEGGGKLNPHCGNFFFHEFEQLFSQLEMDGQLDTISYFTLLQKPGSGGNLVLYDLEWEEAELRPNKDTVEYKDGRQELFADLPQTTLSMDAGDLLLFAGGQIWHQVTSPEAAPTRITMGGFICIPDEYDRYYLWT